MMKDYLPGNNSFFNDNIARKYGYEVASLLAHLMSVDKYFSHNGNGPWFYQTIEQIEKSIGMKRWKQEKALKKLEELGIIEKKIMGMPAKRYFKINYERAAEVAASNEELESNVSVCWKTANKFVGDKQTSLLVTSSNNNIYNNNINNNIYKEKENIKEKESIRSSSKNTPSLSETSKKQETKKQESTKKNFTKKKTLKEKSLKAKEIKNKEIIEEIISYLNEKTNKHFMPKNKQTVKFINGRLSEGYSKEDLKAVIDNRVEKWLNDEKMNEYLRPSTLFRPSNFEAYYNDVLSMKEKAISEKEQEFIEKFSIGLTPPNLTPKQALKVFKEENKINILGENDFKNLEEWYKMKIKDWNKKFTEKIKKESEVKIGERAKVKTNERAERYLRNFDKPRKLL